MNYTLSTRPAPGKKNELGKKGEVFAAHFYAARGAVVLATNVAYPSGEIDLIVREADGTIVFVEVKTRSSAHYGAAEAVTARKFRRMRRAAAQWLAGEKQLREVRFDVLALTAQPGGSSGSQGFDVDYFAGVEHGAG